MVIFLAHIARICHYRSNWCAFQAYGVATLASRIKRRWRVVRLRHKGEILGTVKAAAAVQFGLDEIQRNRIMVQELA